MQSVYFGGSRHLGTSVLVAQVTKAVLAQGFRVHVGCQFGADAQVIYSALTIAPRKLSVFAVAPSEETAPPHVQVAASQVASVTFSAGGTSAPIPARYLLRSIAAFQGCSHAVFFAPGSGSLAVAREFLKYHQSKKIHPVNGIPIFAFQPTAPALIPSVSGHWVASSFAGFSCWQWVAPAQLSLF